jgi:hypothetical protein
MITTFREKIFSLYSERSTYAKKRKEKESSHVGIEALTICSQSTYLTNLKEKTQMPPCSMPYLAPKSPQV